MSELKVNKTWVRAAAVVTAASLSVFALAGCSGSSSSSSSSQESSSASQSESTTESTSSSTTKAAAKVGAKTLASKANTESTTAGTVTTTIDMTSYKKGKRVRVWVPVAQDADYQTVNKVKVKAKGAKTSKITIDKDGNKIAYIEWAKSAKPSTRTATISFHAVRDEATHPDYQAETGKIPSGVKQYLKGSKLVPVNKQVKDAANEIVEGKETDYDKARAIYDWIIANMNRDESVEGCGQGDVCALLSTKSGKCTDINSVFVGLCRAVGIPAREQFGIRMNADDITTNQHCWAEFYLTGNGWVAADPADVLKAVLKNNWTKDQQETKDQAEYYWGGFDSQRVQLSSGRDITLNPKQSGSKLNYFGYPYAEVNGDAIDYYDPENFKYSISFEADA